MQSSHADIAKINRCFLYNALDRDFSMAKYLFSIHIQSNRKAMTKLRLSSHKLMIERGRWQKCLHNDRICTECNVLEDEYHAVIICPRYKELRGKYIKSYYVMRPSMFKFIQLLNTENVKEMRMLATFIKQIFAIYTKYIFN